MSPKLKWGLIIGVFLLAGGVSLIIGFWIAGFDILGWFTTKWAFIVYFFLGAYLAFLGGVFIHDYALGGKQ